MYLGGGGGGGCSFVPVGISWYKIGKSGGGGGVKLY